MDTYSDPKYKNEKIYKHSRRVVLNPTSSGGENAILKFHVFENGDEKKWSRAELTLNCYGQHIVDVDFEFDIERLEALIKAQKEDE